MGLPIPLDLLRFAPFSPWVVLEHNNQLGSSSLCFERVSLYQKSLLSTFSAVGTGGIGEEPALSLRGQLECGRQRYDEK